MKNPKGITDIQPRKNIPQIYFKVYFFLFTAI